MAANKCPKCGKKLKICPGIGPYCPNKKCDIVDSIDNYEDSDKLAVGEVKQHTTPVNQ